MHRRKGTSKKSRTAPKGPNARAVNKEEACSVMLPRKGGFGHKRMPSEVRSPSAQWSMTSNPSSPLLAQCVPAPLRPSTARLVPHLVLVVILFLSVGMDRDCLRPRCSVVVGIPLGRRSLEAEFSSVGRAGQRKKERGKTFKFVTRTLCLS